MAYIQPFRYPGGKFYALSRLRQFWESINHDEYREPFVGGGAVFFDKQKTNFDWINDIDSELITTYNIIKDARTRKRLINELENEEPTKDRWAHYYREFEPTNEYETAKRYYFLNRTSFSGKLVSAAYGYRPKRSVPPHRWHEKIIPSGERLKDTTITNYDFENVISEKSDRSVLMFIDPPYFLPSKKKHYRDGMEKNDHLRLCDLLKRTDHKFFLTYEDNADVKTLYKWANIYKLKFTYRVGDSNQIQKKRQTGKEIVITNYELIEKEKTQYELF